MPNIGVFMKKLSWLRILVARSSKHHGPDIWQTALTSWSSLCVEEITWSETREWPEEADSTTPHQKWAMIIPGALTYFSDLTQWECTNDFQGWHPRAYSLPLVPPLKGPLTSRGHPVSRTWTSGDKLYPSYREHSQRAKLDFLHASCLGWLRFCCSCCCSPSGRFNGDSCPHAHLHSNLDCVCRAWLLACEFPRLLLSAVLPSLPLPPPAGFLSWNFLHTIVHTWRSKGNLYDSVLSFHHVGSRDQTQPSGLVASVFLHLVIADETWEDLMSSRLASNSICNRK